MENFLSYNCSILNVLNSAETRQEGWFRLEMWGRREQWIQSEEFSSALTRVNNYISTTGSVFEAKTLIWYPYTGGVISEALLLFKYRKLRGRWWWFWLEVEQHRRLAATANHLVLSSPTTISSFSVLGRRSKWCCLQH